MSDEELDKIQKDANIALLGMWVFVAGVFTLLKLIFPAVWFIPAIGLILATVLVLRAGWKIDQMIKERKIETWMK